MKDNADKLAFALLRILESREAGRKTGYDTQAKVTRIDEDGVVWVNIPGGVDETPVQRTQNAAAGDEVMVRVADGTAWLLGNKTDPPAGEVRLNIVGEIADMAVRSAGKAQASAEDARRFAGQAYEYASDAKEQAISANRSANSALTQLSVVEDVVGVLEWISNHATYKASADTEVVAGKMYFTKSGDVYTPVASPTGNPSENGYYEIDTIDEAVSNYVSSHLSLTNAGLWVINDNNSYKVLVASDGFKIYDDEGALVSTFGEDIRFSSTKSQYIGGENAYIIFNSENGTMTIGGASLNINVGQKTLSQALIDIANDLDDAKETWSEDSEQTRALVDGKIDMASVDGGTTLLNSFNAIADRIRLTAEQIIFSNSSDVFSEISAIKDNIIIRTNPPSITIGNESEFHIVLTETDIDFYQGETQTAYLNDTALNVMNRIVFADFQFLKRPNGHFTLKFVDEENA